MRMLLGGALLLSCVVLQLFVPYRGQKELTFVPQGVSYLNRDLFGSETSLDTSLIPFRQQGGYGFHSPGLKDFSYTEYAPDKKVIFFGKNILSHNWQTGITSVLNSAGQELGAFPSTGALLLRNERIYELSQATHQIKEFSRAGQLLWQYAYLAPPTMLANNANGTSISYANGRLDVLDSNGLLQHQVRYSGSRVNVIYGQAISPDGQFLAVIGGLDPQRFQLLNLRNGSYYPVTSHVLPEQKNSSYWVSFSKDLPYVFYTLESGLYSYNYKLNVSAHFDFRGRLLSFEENIDRGLQFFLAQVDENQGILLATLGIRGVFFDLDVGRTPYSLVSHGDDIYLTLENAIAHYRVVEI